MAIKFLSGQTISGTLTVSGNVQGATFNGLAINTTGTNNVANQIVRTQANGYANFGWINSVSGNHTGAITRITASNDAYLRYVTPAQFRTGVTDGYYAPVSTVSGVTSVATTNGITGGTIVSTGTIQVDSTVIRTTGGQTIANVTTLDDLDVIDTLAWRVSSTDAARQRADARDDATSFSRLHWFGKSDTAGTSNFRHAYYDGANYINVTAASGAVTFTGILAATGGNSTEWNTSYDNSITGLAVTGTTTKTLTATQQDGGTLTASWTDNNTGTVTSSATTSYIPYMSTATNVANSQLLYDTTNSRTILTATVGPNDDIRGSFIVRDDTPMAANVGGQIALGYRYLSSGGYTEGALIRTYKENAVDGEYGSGLKIQVRNTGPGLSTKFTLDPSGNVTIPGSLTFNGTSTSPVGMLLRVDSGNVNAITIDNVGSTTFSGYTYFPNYLFHEGDTNTRIQFTTGTITLRGDSGITLDGPTTTNANFIGTTASFSGLVSGISPTAAANFATKAYVDANNTSWPNVGAGIRTNYDLGIKPPVNGYAGFYFQTETGAGAGYFLIRGGGASGAYTDQGISLIADAGWLSLVSRTTTNKGVRIMAGAAATTRMRVESDGFITMGNPTVSNTYTPAQGYVAGISSPTAGGQTYLSISMGGSALGNTGVAFGLDAGGASYYMRDNLPIRFYTNNTFSMLISASGKLGVNVTNPLAKLHVVGTNDVFDGWGYLSLVLENSSNFPSLLFKHGVSGTLLRRDSSNNFQIANGDSTTLTKRFQINSNGRVGIGSLAAAESMLQFDPNNSAASPGAKNYTGSAINTDGGDIATGRVFFQGSSSGATDMCGINNETSRIVLYNYTDSRYLQYWDHAGSSFIPNGNLGIGTTVNGFRGERLFVDGEVRQQSTVGVNPQGATRGGLAAYDNTTGWGAGIGGQLVLGYIYTGSSYTEGALIKMYKENSTQGHYGSGLRWAVRQNGTNLTPKMDLSPSGTLTVIQDIVAYGSPSDKKLKENIKPIESALDKVKKLQGVTFDWKESDSMLDIKEDIGFIAQDVKEIVPELVRENSNGLLSMRHQGIAPILLEAIKEQQKQIDDLKLQMKNFK
jgi:uncharacterized protein YfiM (DUF2279 family)